jgi:peptide-methionine (S)-S-oxide reductase
MFLLRKKSEMPSPGSALKGRPEPIATADQHEIFGRPLKGPYPDGIETIWLGMGCFWGAERKFWELGSGVWITAVGYGGGFTPNPTYEEVSTGKTGHTELVLVAFDPKVLPLSALLRTFWESHDPTQGMRQGNDTGTQYRSAIYCSTEAQLVEALASRKAYEAQLLEAGFGPITTEVSRLPDVYFAEAYHQQYLIKVPHGYCGLKGTGVACA